MATRRVTLVPMAEAEYRDFLETAIPHYAEANVGAGYWPEEEALERSRQAYASLLPDGLATPENHLYVARDAERGDKVGTLWIAMQPRTGGIQAYIYSIAIDESLRGQGYGRAVMEACAEQARTLGAVTVGLHVFAQNEAACRLYESLGYRTMSQSMALTL